MNFIGVYVTRPIYFGIESKVGAARVYKEQIRHGSYSMYFEIFS